MTTPAVASAGAEQGRLAKSFGVCPECRSILVTVAYCSRCNPFTVECEDWRLVAYGHQHLHCDTCRIWWSDARAKARNP